MTEPTIFIRDAAASDFHEVMSVEKEAFGYEKEAILVAELLEDPTAQPVVSLLAFVGDEPAGHILFTKASLEGPGPAPSIYLLAPARRQTRIPEQRDRRGADPRRPETAEGYGSRDGLCSRS